jgi:ribosomal protein S18 acetylase RimI-like enzyme
MITCEDWREAPSATVGELFEAECARWEAGLGWNYRPACRLLELARQKGHLPGLLARGRDGRVVGWVYFLLHDRTLQVGNLVADETATALTLLDRALCSPTSRAVEGAFATRAFTTDRHTYMVRALTPEGPGRRTAGPSGPRSVRVPPGYEIAAWSPRLIPDVVQLLAQAYSDMHQARCFAPDGRLDQWTSYVGQLVQTPACGRFEHRLSVVAHTRAGELAAAVLVTALADRTAHIAQMAVAAGHRGRGMGERLVRVVCERARGAGFERMTLLVADSNHAARRLYARTGFEAAADFLFADREARAAT